MRILISGASGLVGTALAKLLRERGDTPVGLTRSLDDDAIAQVQWDPKTGKIDRAALENLDAVVHLAGENVSDGRWNAEKKRRILESRVQGTTLLCEALAQTEAPPKVLVSASAMGYYGDTGDRTVDEQSPAGEGFLAEVCLAWEAATAPAEDAGIRVVHYRIGLVLSNEGGALPKMLPPFKLGLGGVIGNGRMWMSWIAIDDLVHGIAHCIDNPAVFGPVNAVAPYPVTNRDFTKTLGAVLHRPAILPLPASALRFALGEMGDALLLASTRVQPVQLVESGYAFRWPSLRPALLHLMEEND